MAELLLAAEPKEGYQLYSADPLARYVKLSLSHHMAGSLHPGTAPGPQALGWLEPREPVPGGVAWPTFVVHEAIKALTEETIFEMAEACDAAGDLWSSGLYVNCGAIMLFRGGLAFTQALLIRPRMPQQVLLLLDVDGDPGEWLVDLHGD